MEDKRKEKIQQYLTSDLERARIEKNNLQEEESKKEEEVQSGNPSSYFSPDKDENPKESSPMGDLLRAIRTERR